MMSAQGLAAGRAASEVDAVKRDKIKVAVALSNNLLSAGLCRLLEEAPSLEVDRVVECGAGQGADMMKAICDHVVLVDFPVLFNSFPKPDEVDAWPATILLDTSCGMNNIITAIFRKKLRGVLTPESSCRHLVKAIESVARGEVWIDNETVKGLMNSFDSTEGFQPGFLTDRENEIVELVGKGYRNKEIARLLRISEPTVKTHLSRIFKKLNIKTRYELVVFAVKYSVNGAGS